MLGPQQMPPQGAKALLRGLFGAGGKGRPEVAGTLVNGPAGEAAMDFLNEGGDTAVGIRWIARRDDGSVAAHDVGDLPPGASTTVHVDVGEDARVVWCASDSHGRFHLWSYEGRRKRSRHQLSDEAVLRAFYR